MRAYGHTQQKVVIGGAAHGAPSGGFGVNSIHDDYKLMAQLNNFLPVRNGRGVLNQKGI
jgi:hypothetical protein